jgi:hypothetical protein
MGLGQPGWISIEGTGSTQCEAASKSYEKCRHRRRMRLSVPSRWRRNNLLKSSLNAAFSHNFERALICIKSGRYGTFWNMGNTDDLPEDAGAMKRLNVLYLVTELERAVNLGGIAWTTEDAEHIPGRLANVSSMLRRQAGN